MSNRSGRLLSASIVTLAGGITLGLGGVASAIQRTRGEVASVWGGLLIVAGGLVWLAELARYYGLLPEPDSTGKQSPSAPPDQDER